MKIQDSGSGLSAKKPAPPNTLAVHKLVNVSDILLTNPANYVAKPLPVDLGSPSLYIHQRKKKKTVTKTEAKPVPKRVSEFKRLRKVVKNLVNDLLIYLLLATVIFICAYGQADPNNHRYLANLNRVFLNSKNNPNNIGLKNVLKPGDVWQWLQRDFLNALYSQKSAHKYISGFRLAPTRELLSDVSSYVLGHAVLKQERVDSSNCPIGKHVQSKINFCYGAYSTPNRQTGSFSPGWKPLSTTTINQTTIASGFIYNNSYLNKSYGYNGRLASYASGAYVLELRGTPAQLSANFTGLEQAGWIDRQTRAVILDLTTFNPNVNSLANLIIMFEFPPGGGVLASSQVSVVNLNAYSLLVKVACIILLVLLILVMLRELLYMMKRGCAYFKRGWNAVLWVLIAFAWTTVGLYVNTVYSSFVIFDTLAPNGGGYVSIHDMIAYGEPMMICLAFSVFFVTIYSLRLFTFYKKIAGLSERFKHALGETLCFMCIIIIVLVSFAHLFCTEFNTDSIHFADFLRSFVSTLKLACPNCFFESLYKTRSIAAPLLICIYKLIVWFVLVHVFIMLMINALRGSVNPSDLDVQKLYGFVARRVRKVTCNKCCRSEKRLGKRVDRKPVVTVVEQKQKLIVVELNTTVVDSRTSLFTLIDDRRDLLATTAKIEVVLVKAEGALADLVPNQKELSFIMNSFDVVGEEHILSVINFDEPMINEIIKEDLREVTTEDLQKKLEYVEYVPPVEEEFEEEEGEFDEDDEDDDASIQIEDDSNERFEMEYVSNGVGFVGGEGREHEEDSPI